MIKLTKVLIILSTILLSINTELKAQGLFDINTLRTVNINFYDADWDHQLDSLASLNSGTGSGTQRILATVIFDGIAFDSCGVRYKGNSSMDTSSNKNPFNIDLNYVIAGQDYFGKDKIKLANCFTDPSMVREALTYEIANQYMDCPHASFVKLYINSNYIGIYTNTESIDNEFLDEYYGSSDNPFFKCDPVSFELYGDNSNLSYQSDSMAYDTLYDRKSLYGLSDLQTLCYNLENNITSIEQYLDVDRALWFLAVSSALVHNDGYTAFGHNYYVYKMDNGRWSIVLWDVNMSFGGLLWNGTNFWPLALTDLQEQDPYLHDMAYNFRPLIAQLLTVPSYKRMYTAHYKTIMEENVNNNNYLSRAQFMSTLIDADVFAEPYNAYTYQEFQDNLTLDVGTGFNLRPGLQNLMGPRENYIYTLNEFNALQPTISNVGPASFPVQANASATILADVADETSVSLGYRYNRFDVFTKTVMFDDGLHNDGAAGDGTYGADIAVFNSDVQYYVYADNGNASKFSPTRAEYEFYTLSPEKTLVINELSALNQNIATDPVGEYEDWIELYNNSANPISLNGYYMSDDAANLFKWPFPDTTLNPNEYLVLWADNQFQPGLHAGFNLDQAGESLHLIDDMGQIVDEVQFPAQIADITYGRLPNGTGPFTLLYPTIGAQNTTPLNVFKPEISRVKLSVYPNPASDEVNIKFSESVDRELFLYNSIGKLIKTIRLNHQDKIQLCLIEHAKGLYFIQSNLGETAKFIKD